MHPHNINKTSTQHHFTCLTPTPPTQHPHTVLIGWTRATRQLGLTHPHSHFIHEISTHNFERLYQSAQRVGAVVLVHQHNTHFTSTTSTSPAQNSHTVLRGWKRVPRQSQQMNRCTHTLILPTHHQQNTHTPPLPTHNTHSTHTTPKYSFKRLE